MFTPEDLAQVDLHEFVRREQGRFFRGGVYDPHEAAALIVLEALLVGAVDVRVVQSGGWVSVYSESDWHAELEGDVFGEFVPIRQGGQNSVTAEVLLVVFSSAVVTAENGEVDIVKGESLGPLAGHVPERGRVVAFRLD